jgi:threonine/homoserine/homoserine lactone efflux protein
MFSTLAKIIPLDLAVVLGSPGILAVVIIVLGSRNHPKAHVLSFLLGAFFTGIGITILGFVLGNSVHTEVKQTLTASIIDIVLGLFLVIYGLKIFFSPERKASPRKEEDALKIFKWFGIGLIVTVTNFDSLFLSFTASKEVGGADIHTLAKWILLIINLFFFVLPITTPLFLKLIFPKIAEPILAKINGFMVKYSRYIVFVMFIIFGIYLLYRGLHYFI